MASTSSPMAGQTPSGGKSAAPADAIFSDATAAIPHKPTHSQLVFQQLTGIDPHSYSKAHRGKEFFIFSDLRIENRWVSDRMDSQDWHRAAAIWVERLREEKIPPIPKSWRSMRTMCVEFEAKFREALRKAQAENKMNGEFLSPTYQTFAGGIMESNWYRTRGSYTDIS
jgi:hypothetical protein